MQGKAIKPDPKKGLEFYMDTNFTGRWNQEEGKEPSLVLSRTVYVIAYTNCMIIWVIRIQTEIVLSTTEAEYITLYQLMRGFLTFVSLMKEIDFILNI